MREGYHGFGAQLDGTSEMSEQHRNFKYMYVRGVIKK